MHHVSQLPQDIRETVILYYYEGESTRIVATAQNREKDTPSLKETVWPFKANLKHISTFAVILSNIGLIVFSIFFLPSDDLNQTTQNKDNPTRFPKNENLITKKKREQALPAEKKPVASAFRIRLIDTEGSSIKGGGVMVIWYNQTPDKIRTDSITEMAIEVGPGEFVLYEPHGHAVELSAAAPGFLPEQAQYDVKEDNPDNVVELVLEKGEPFFARLVDPHNDDTPIKNAHISFLKGWFQYPGHNVPDFLDASLKPSFFYDTKSDTQGMFSVTGVPGLLWIEHEDFNPIAVIVYGDINCGSQETPCTILMNTPTSLFLSVKWDNDEAVTDFKYSVAGFPDHPSTIFSKSSTFYPKSWRKVQGSEVTCHIYQCCELVCARPNPEGTISLTVTSNDISKKRTATIQWGIENVIKVVLALKT